MQLENLMSTPEFLWILQSVIRSTAEHWVDVMFLDIQMPRIQGTDFLRSLKSLLKIIFTTAHPGYAVEGFELNAVYLLKPVTFPRFKQAIEKVEQQLNPEQHILSTVPSTSQSEPKDDFIFY